MNFKYYDIKLKNEVLAKILLRFFPDSMENEEIYKKKYEHFYGYYEVWEAEDIIYLYGTDEEFDFTLPHDLWGIVESLYETITGLDIGFEEQDDFKLDLIKNKSKIIDSFQKSHIYCVIWYGLKDIYKKGIQYEYKGKEPLKDYREVHSIRINDDKEFNRTVRTEFNYGWDEMFEFDELYEKW